MKLLICAIGLLIVLASGRRFALPTIDPVGVIIFCFVVGGLWIIAIALSVWDHIRYQGWELLYNRHQTTVNPFVKALLAVNYAEALTRCSADYRLKHNFRDFERTAEELIEQLGDRRLVLTLDEPGRAQLPILGGAVSLLNGFAGDAHDAVGLVLFHGPGLQINRELVPSLRMRLKHESDEFKIDDFDFVEVSLNQSTFEGNKGTVGLGSHHSGCSLCGRRC
jgi:hypothetical protein